jgi:hypothetical protein
MDRNSSVSEPANQKSTDAMPIVSVVLAANPLDDIRNTRRIEAVYVAGHKVQ